MSIFYNGIDVTGESYFRSLINGSGDIVTIDTNNIVRRRTIAQTLLDIDAVPYTGATKNVNLGEFGLSTGNIRFDITPTNIPEIQGAVYWDVDDNTIAIIMNGSIQKVGEDSFYPVKNQTGTLIPKGTNVRFAGTVGNSGRLLIAPFIANGTFPSSYYMGVTMENIADGADGKVMWFGRIRGLNTNSYNEGDILYVSTTVAGGFQTTIPQAPNNIIEVAAVITKSINQGVIFIRPTIGSNINRDEGVRIVSGTTGQLLQLQSNGLWENKTLGEILGGTSSQFVKGNGTLDSTVYQPLLTNPVSGTGTTNYITKFSSTTTLANSQIFDNGVNVGINTNTPDGILNIVNSLSGTTKVLNVQGIQGQLATVTDSLQGVLMSVNDISGLPILEVSSDNTIKMGTFGSEALIVSGSTVSLRASTTASAATQIPVFTADPSSTTRELVTRTPAELLGDAGGISGTGTTNQLAYFTGASTIASLSTATYPSLTELSYVKGVTSAIQTQLNGKQNAITLTTTGASGASTLVGSTLNVPTYTLAGLGGVPTTRELTINGTAFDLSANRSWSVGTVTNVSALTIGTTGTDVSSTVVNGTTTPTITLNIPTASATNRGALSSADWTTFNTKIGGSIASGQVAFGSASGVISGDSGLQWNNSTKVFTAIGLQTFQGTTASDTAPLGSELATTGSGTNWTGSDFATGYTHTAGSTAPLTTSIAAVNATYYQIAYTVTGRTAGSFTINYGGTSTSGLTATGATGPLTTSTANLEIVPTSDFNGTIVLSIKSIGISSATTTFRSSDGTARIEIRATTALQNTLIGIRAGKRITTGTNNTFVGVFSGDNNTTGGGNSFFGVSAGRDNATGVNNSFFGLQAGLNNTTGGSNSFFGLNAGQSNTTGGNNTFFGANAGRLIANGSNLTIGNNSVFIGFGTRANADNETNQTVIGYNAIGLGSNTTVIGNSSTTFGRWWGKLLIGTSTDGGQNLQVAGTVAIRATASITLQATHIPVFTSNPASTTQELVTRTPAQFRGDIGATTVGGNLFTLENPSAIRFIRINADNTVSALSDSDFRIAIGAGTGTGSVTSIATNNGITGGTITTTGTIGLTGQALALHNLATNGLIARTGAGAVAGRTIEGTTNQITITNGDGVSGNPTLSLPQNIHTAATPTFGGLTINGNILITNVLLSNQQNLDVDSGASRVIATASTTYQAVFFDFVIKKGVNMRGGTIYSVYDGTNVEFIETSTNDLGNTNEVVLSVDVSGGNIRLLATTSTNDWSIKTLVRGL